MAVTIGTKVKISTGLNYNIGVVASEINADAWGIDVCVNLNEANLNIVDRSESGPYGDLFWQNNPVSKSVVTEL